MASIDISLKDLSVAEATLIMNTLAQLSRAVQQQQSAAPAQSGESTAPSDPAVDKPTAKSDPAVAPEPAKRRGRPRKVQPAEQPVTEQADAEQLAAKQEEQQEEATEQPAEQAIVVNIPLTAEERKQTLKAIYEKSPAKAIALLARFGVQSLVKLKEEQLPEFDALAAKTLIGAYDPEKAN